MSFSLPLQALGTFQLVIRIPGNGAPMRPSFELKSLPVAELLKQSSCDALTSSCIHFEAVEDVDGLGVVLVVSKEPEQIRWRSLPGSPSSQHQALSNYLETEDRMQINLFKRLLANNGNDRKIKSGITDGIREQHSAKRSKWCWQLRHVIVHASSTPERAYAWNDVRYVFLRNITPTFVH
ncbi:hypothetical protein VNI00_004801 [Paramarasmius palmivorus]|uniref:Uncharacterized protein n=1 Tax=Paramarasmius palmivorus TaxID=297713 RepID=A0AAW0DIX8_9AGAR